MDANGKPYNRILMVATMIAGTFIMILSSTMLATAFPALMKAFDVNTSTVQWLTTGFLLVNGVMIPISAWLINRFSTRVLYMSAMTIFLLGTTLAFVATNFATIFIGRLVQAIAVGISMPLSQTVNLSIFPPEKRGAVMGTLGLAIGLAPAIGPTLSGFIVDNYSWRTLFGMLIPLVLLVIIISFFTVRKVLETSKPSLDFSSAILSTIGFGLLLYGFSEVGDKGWGDPVVLVSILVGLVVIGFFTLRQLKMDNPFLNIRVFANKDFFISAILSADVNIAMIGIEMVFPIYLQTIRGESAFESGLTLLPGALMMGIMSPITGRIFDRIGAKRLAMAGLSLVTIGTIPFIFLTTSTPTIFLTVSYAIRMAGVAMTMMPVTTAGMNALSFKEISHGTAVNNTLRQVAGSVGTAVLISVLSNVTSNEMPAKHVLHEAPLLYKDQAQNAVLGGYSAAFVVATGFAIVGLIVTFFLKKTQTFGGEK
ncbi:MDR family MFS transporter [Lentilactobacillus sp. Marseille-Q4993]|uniref:MDR family MFS transporter n=1 Tax=Lentilactobacillus sp. Marseille-Q4993 TaxID=3039492 RepID=UPI0024BC99C3|nr:MDR family MFS transporter [Lentilactobacillus sp. Marseille-Q4993]